MRNVKFTILVLFAFVPAVFSAGNSEGLPSVSVEIDKNFISPSTSVAPLSFSIEHKNIKKIKSWELTIYNEDSKKIKSFGGVKILPRKILWNFLDDKNKVVKDGKYKYELFVNDGKNNFSHSYENITIDSVVPVASLKISNNVYLLIKDGKLNKTINIYPSAGDETEIDYSQSFIKVFNFKGIEIKKFNILGGMPNFIIWDGIDDIYDAIVPTGNYKIVISVTDKAGNNFSAESAISIIKLKEEKPEAEVLKVDVLEENNEKNVSEKKPLDAVENKPKTSANVSEKKSLDAVKNKPKTSASKKKKVAQK
jgi:hypothetical protein